MNNFTYKTQTGMEVTLNAFDMQEITTHFKIQSEADFLRENYSELSEEVIQQIATETVEIINNSFSGEDEAIAIKKAFSKFNIPYHGISY